MIDLPVYDPDNWQNRAQCAAERIDPNTMAPETASPEQVEEAKAVCFRCPVMDQCRDAAAAQSEAYGIWGGEWWGVPAHSPARVSCQWCGCDVANAGTGRVRQFCGASCRQRSRRARETPALLVPA